VKKTDWGDVVGLIFILALLVILVRPSSIAPQFVTAFGDGLTSLVSFAVAG
jgi:aromatic ring-opening dioxygenase LigB subunit